MLTVPSEVASRPLPLVVIGVSVLCSAAFLYALTLPAAELGSWIERWGLVSREVVREAGEGGVGRRWLTPWSAVFLHASLAHLCGNLFYLWLFGEALEAALGSVRFVALFLVSALAAALVHMAAVPGAYLPAVGASGAISGLVGAYLIVHRSTPLRRRWYPLGLSPGVFMGLWCLFVLLGGLLSSPGYAAWSHLGGFLAGATFCGVLALRRRSPKPACSGEG